MKFFEDYTPPRQENTPVKVDSSSFIKQNLLKGVDKPQEIYKAIEAWLFSFEGAMSRKLFDAQLKRLDHDAKTALQQLEKAKGYRRIPLPPPPKMPLLEKPLIEQMLETPFVAIYGRGFKKVFKETLNELKQLGEAYVLSVEDLIIEFKAYNDKGKAPYMIQKAIDADFLFIAGLERTIHLEWHIREAIERIGRQREEKGNRLIISTWHRFNDCNQFFERFSIFMVE